MLLQTFYDNEYLIYLLDIDFLLLHLDGWGSFDFSVISVQFLIRYMCSSAVIIFLAKLGKWAVKHTLEGGRDV